MPSAIVVVVAAAAVVVHVTDVQVGLDQLPIRLLMPTDYDGVGGGDGGGGTGAAADPLLPSLLIDRHWLLRIHWEMHSSVPSIKRPKYNH